MSEENRNIVAENVEVIEDEEIKESKIKELFSKAGAGIRKHGPKLAAGAAAVGLGLIGYMLGRGSDGTDYEASSDADTGAGDAEYYSESDSEE